MNKLFAFFIILCFGGCATIGGINQSAKEVNYLDGVSQQEAVAIAQKYCLDDRGCRGNFVISVPQRS
jgi:hypothetical protein